MYLIEELRDAVSAYPVGKIKTHLVNAVPHAPAFTGFRGMPPHNNPAGPAIRDHVVPQHNVRHKISTSEGRETFSRIATLAGTAGKNRTFAGRVAVEVARNPGWNMLDHGP